MTYINMISDGSFCRRRWCAKEKRGPWVTLSFCMCGRSAKIKPKNLRGGEGTVDWDAVASNCSTENCLSNYNKRISSRNSNWEIWARWGFPTVSSPFQKSQQEGGMEHRTKEKAPQRGRQGSGAWGWPWVAAGSRFDPRELVCLYLHTIVQTLLTLLGSCVSSLRRGHADLLRIVPTVTDDPQMEIGSPPLLVFLLYRACMPELDINMQ